MKPIIVDIPGVNPEPWTAPSVVRGKGGRIVAIKGGKNDAYQRALAEVASDIEAPPPLPPANVPFHVTFYFWRSTEDGNQADATNLLKATEDALQGVFYANDVQNHHVEAVVVEQSPDVEPRILIHIESFKMPELPDQPAKLPTVNASSTATDARDEDAAWRAANDPAPDF